MNYLEPVTFCNEVVKLVPAPGPLLSLCAGRNKVGLAISQVPMPPCYYPKNKAKHFGTLVWNRKEPELMSCELQSLISAHSVSGLVIGHPCRPRLTRYRPRGELLVDDIIKTGKLQPIYYTYFDDTETTKNIFKRIKIRRRGVRDFNFSDEHGAFEILETFLYMFHPLSPLRLTNLSMKDWQHT